MIGGKLYLNGRPLNLRGVGLHEDDPTVGFAVDNARRAQYIAEVKELGATIIRAHYPLHPYLEELADRDGILLWSEVPVYAVKTQYLKREIVRKLAAKELAANINANQNHPSIIVWSMGNELSSRPGPVQGDYIRRGDRAGQGARPDAPGRPRRRRLPVGRLPARVRAARRHRHQRLLRLVPGPERRDRRPRRAARTTSTRSAPATRSKAIMVTEFGAEANRDGPVEEKGTYQFQQDFVNYHLGVFATKPWLSGAIYWALQEFRVRPGWDGGNPRPDPADPPEGPARASPTARRSPRGSTCSASYTADAADRPRCRASSRAGGATLSTAMATNQGTRLALDPARHLRWLPRDAPPAPHRTGAGRAVRRRGRAGLLHRRRARAAPRARRERRRPRARARRAGRRPPSSRTRSTTRCAARRCTSISCASGSTWRSTRRSPSSSPAPTTPRASSQGGVLEQVTREVNVEALPNDIPEIDHVRRLEDGDQRHAVPVGARRPARA